jgi:vitamin B12 transporter
VVLVETTAPSDYQINRFSGEYGSHDTKRASAQVGGQFGALGLVAGAGWYDSDGISSARAGLEPDGYRQYAAHGRATFEKRFRPEHLCDSFLSEVTRHLF